MMNSAIGGAREIDGNIRVVATISIGVVGAGEAPRKGTTPEQKRQC
jgi:hypothetical protein